MEQYEALIKENEKLRERVTLVEAEKFRELEEENAKLRDEVASLSGDLAIMADVQGYVHHEMWIDATHHHQVLDRKADGTFDHTPAKAAAAPTVQLDGEGGLGQVLLSGFNKAISPVKKGLSPMGKHPSAAAATLGASEDLPPPKGEPPKWVKFSLSNEAAVNGRAKSPSVCSVSSVGSGSPSPFQHRRGSPFSNLLGRSPFGKRVSTSHVTP